MKVIKIKYIKYSKNKIIITTKIDNETPIEANLKISVAKLNNKIVIVICIKCHY